MACEPVRILIADDEPMVLSLVRSVLEDKAEYRLETATNGEEALDKLRETDPDLLITDLKMPRMSGEELIAEAKVARPLLTVLVMTANGTVESAVSLMKEGVFDYVTKPFKIDDFLSTVERAVEKIRSHPLSRESLAIVGSLMTALETKDQYLKSHCDRVSVMVQQLSLDLGLSPREAFIIRRAALVHDLGKIGVHETILNKKGPLTSEEFGEVKKHPDYSARILRPLKEFRECLEEVYHHHERVDGSGYPDGIAGATIPIGARIIAVCDAFDAMASDRSYRSAMDQQTIIKNLLHGRGTQFDAEVVDVFLKQLEKR